MDLPNYYHTIVEQAPFAIFILKDKDFKIESVNKQNLILWQKDPNEVLGKPLFDVFSELKSQVLEHTLEEVYDKGVTHIRKEVPFKKTTNGIVTTEWYDMTYEPLRDEDGQVKRIMVVTKEVTDRFLAKMEAEENEKGLKALDEIKAKKNTIFNNTLLESSIDCLKILDINGQITFMNKNGLSLMEIDDYSEIDKKVWWDLWGDENKTIIQDAVSKALSGESINFTAYCPTTKGKPKWWNVSVSPIGTPDDGIEQILSISRDITEKRREEQAKKNSELFNRMVLESSPDCLQILDTEGRLQFINENGLCQMEIDDFDTVKNQYWWNFWGEENQNLVKEAFLKAKSGKTAEFTAFCPAAKGTPKWWHVMVSPVKDSDEHVTQLISVSRDITQRKENELELRKTYEFLNAGLKVANVVLFEIDYTTNLAKLSPDAAELYGLSKEELNIPRQKIHDTFHPEFKEELEAQINQALASGYDTIIELEHPIVLSGGDVRWVKVNKQLFFNHDVQPPMLLYSISAAKDITYRKEWEEKLKQTQNKLNLTVENVNASIFLFRANGKMIFANEKAAHLYKYDSVEALLSETDFSDIKKKIVESYHVFDENHAVFDFENLPSYVTLKTKKPFETTILLVDKKNQTHKWILAKSAPLLDNNGELSVVIVTATDITHQKITEVKIKESEELFRTISNSIPQLAWMTNADGWIYWYNDRWYDYTGTTFNEMEGWGWQAVHHPELVTAVKERFKQAIATQQNWEDTFLLRSKTGEYRWFLSRALPIRNEKGEIVRWFGTNTDITEQRLTEEALKNSEEKYRGIFEKMDQAFCIVEVLFDADNNPIDFLYLECNDQFEIHTGLKDAIGKTMRQLVPNIEQHWVQIYGKIALTGQPARFVEGSEEMGRIFDVYAFRIGDDRSRKVAILFTDTTEKKKAENQLKMSEEKFRLLTETLPQLVWMTDEKGITEYISSQWIEYAGIVPNEEHWQHIVHIDDRKIMQDEWEISTLSGEIFHAETRLKNKDGQYRWHVTMGVPLKNEQGVITKWIGTFTDIHEQKLKEQKKDEFISIASHEMKTPLTTAKAYLQLLEMTLEEDDASALYAKKASDAIDRLHSLITELLDASKIQNGKLNYTLTTFNFNEMLESTIESIQHSSKTHKILKSGMITEPFWGDKDRLQQVIINLLTNAIKYSPNANKVLVHIEQDDYHLKVSVTDKGVGLSEKHLAKIFERYYRVEEHAIQFQGLGIGLYISYDIIQRHNGRMWVESKPNKGSTFYFVLPLNNQKNE